MAEISKEKQQWLQLPGPVVQKQFHGIDHETPVKIVRFDLNDSRLRYGTANDGVSGNYRHAFGDQNGELAQGWPVESAPLDADGKSVETLHTRNINANPVLYERLGDCGGPISNPVAIPVWDGKTVNFVLADGNSSVAQMRERLRHKKTPCPSEWDFVVVDPDISELDKESLALLHCGKPPITPWSTYASWRKISRMIELGMPENIARRRVGFNDKTWRTHQDAHKMHVEYMQRFPHKTADRTTQKVHTKISRLTENVKKSGTDFTPLYTPTMVNDWLDAISLGMVPDTDIIGGKKVLDVLSNQEAVATLKAEGFIAALPKAGYVQTPKSNTWTKGTRQAAHTGADRLFGDLDDAVLVMTTKLDRNDITHLVETKADLQAKYALVQSEYSALLENFCR